MSRAHAGICSRGSGMDSLPTQLLSIKLQKLSCLLQASLISTFPSPLTCLSIAIMWSRLNLPAGTRGFTLTIFPTRLCTSLSPSSSQLMAASMAVTSLIRLSSGIDQVHSTVSYSMPKTIPLCEGPKLFSGSSLGANLIPSLSATRLNVSSNLLTLSDPSAPAAHVSSKCWHTILLSNFAIRITMSSTIFAKSSKMPALEALPKIRHNSLKNFPAQLNHCRSVSSSLTAICL